MASWCFVLRNRISEIMMKDLVFVIDSDRIAKSVLSRVCVGWLTMTLGANVFAKCMQDKKD